MKLISLNIWCAKLQEPFMQFLEDKREATDIFCFQEVTDEGEDSLFKKIAEALPEFEGYFGDIEDTRELAGKDMGKPFGLAIFIKKDIEHQTPELIQIYKGRIATFGFPKAMQYIRLTTRAGKEVTVGNIHGLVDDNPLSKMDSEERLEQSRIIKSFIDTEKNSREIILCGDFNLNPTTESIAMLETDLKNLIKEYKITETRTKFYEGPERFADYTLTSKGVTVKDFAVLEDVVSDHKAMQLDCE